jgi:ABC-type phosphate/phosphonate transport system substrate-binding protein
MYDLSECRSSADAWYSGLAQHLKAHGLPAPSTLDRRVDSPSLWTSLSLLLSQTCGLPLTHALDKKVTFVGTLEYDTDGCQGGLYCSFVVTRLGHRHSVGLERKRVAVNSVDSMSGRLALEVWLDSVGVEPGKVVWTGSHRASLASVRNGDADICAVDCVLVGLLKRHAPSELEGLVEIARTGKVPGLPLVTSLSRSGDVERIRAAILDAMNDESLAKARKDLLINGLSDVKLEDYDEIRQLEKRTRHVLLDPDQRQSGNTE